MSKAVFRIQLALFSREKGMLIFYFICIALIGVAVSVFYHGMAASLPSAAMMTTVFLKPILADSLAGEREKKTLESLLSTQINGKAVIWGKFRFSLLFAAGFFGATVLCAALTNMIAGYGIGITAWQWVCALIIAMLNFAAIAVAGVYASATSADTRTANSRVSRIAYIFGLLLMVYLSVLFVVEFAAALVAGAVLALVYICAALVCAVKAANMKQSAYFENVKVKKSRAPTEHYGANPPKSQFGIVFGHELRYLLTLKTLLLNFLFLCFCPAIVVALLKYFIGGVNLYYGVLLTALMMPRTPASLIAYSIGGEKIYKTGESLLSTPLRVRPMFLAKSMIPIVVSAIMLVLSALLTLIAANLIGAFAESGSVYKYTADQLVLLFPAGIMSCVAMVFITGILSVNMKTPRQGLYVSSVLGIIFAAPPLAIVYLTRNALMWSAIYFAVLLLCDALCVKAVSDKTNRPQIMSKL
jgi:ABC-type Na+ efflux pump permease subunit